MSEQVSSTSPAAALPVEDISAGAGRYYRNTRIVLALGLLLYGVASIHDGFFKWPDENDKVREVDPLSKMPHSDVDILFNRVLGVVLPPGGLLLLGWMLYQSRGRIQLRGQALSVPGHPPLTLNMIESVDKTKWERKGIALVTYRQENGKLGTFKLDDFVYDRHPIDQIFARIEAALAAPRQPKAPAVAAAPRFNFPPPPPRPRL